MSEPIDEILHAASTLADPVAALRAALIEAGRALAGRGGTPVDMLAMTWSSREPAAIHPARRCVDLAYRDVFGGRRPTIDVVAADHDGVCVDIRVGKPSTLPAGPIWNGFTLPELARQYSPRATVPDDMAILAHWHATGAVTRAKRLTAELAYGAAAEETLDLYTPAGRGPHPLWIFIHGGYWVATDAAAHARFASGMLDAGYAVAILDYTFAPRMPVAGIVRQMQAAISFLAREARALDCDPERFHTAGHSAGGHLVAMLAALPEGRLIRSCLPLSGLFDLAPLAALPMGPLLGLDKPGAVSLLSPQFLRPLSHIRVGVAVGGKESAEFQRQSVDFARTWGNAPCRIIAGKNHFDLLDGLEGGELLDFAVETARP